MDTHKIMTDANSKYISAKLRSVIAERGAISFAEYMQIALYDSTGGYYSAASSPVFGKDGDFITAPQMGNILARCVAAQCAEVLRLLPGSDILECGAGNGQLAHDVLAHLQQIGCLPKRYLIHEISPVMRQRQQKLLGDNYAGVGIEWLEQAPSISLAAGFSGVILANEVVDALPFHSLVLRSGQWRERYVAACGEGFIWQEQALPDYMHGLLPDPQRLPAELAEYPDGYLTECRSNMASWLKDISASLQQGLLLCLDYGYPQHEYLHPQRFMGSMLCHYRHQVDDNPLQNPGDKDITASVDFTALANAATAGGMQLYGYTTQAGFLLSMGVDKMLKDASERQQLASLMYHNAMGEKFQVMALAKGLQDVLPSPCNGFTMQDHRYRL